MDAGTHDASSSPESGTPDATSEAAPLATGTHVRFADWTPDAPAAGFSFCLAPQGSSNWMGPFLPQGLPYPGTGAYAAVPPGDYEVQVVAASSGDCTMGVIPTSYGLPALADGTYATIATIGDVTPTGGDAQIKVVAFFDDVSGAADGLKLRAINAAPRIGYAQFGTGSQAGGDFSALFSDVAFGTASSAMADGGATDTNGYALLAPLSGAELSAYPIVGDSTQAATASQVSLATGITATLVLVGGADNGPPPQIMICNEVGAAAGSASPCMLYSQ